MSFREDSGDVSLKIMLNVFCNRVMGLKIVHINAQSLFPKIEEFRFLFEKSNIDAICISETWFSPDIEDISYKLNGYMLFRSDRCSRGGGVAIFIKEGLAFRKVCHSSASSSYEYLFINIFGVESSLLQGVVYRPNRYVDLSPFII